MAAGSGVNYSYYMRTAAVAFVAAAFLVSALSTPAAEAGVSCGTVTSKLVGCLPYLRGQGRGPSGPCCGGVRSLKAAAQTPQDRQAACGCIKQAYHSIPGIRPGNAASLPGKCGVNIGYPISPNIDCSRVR